MTLYVCYNDSCTKFPNAVKETCKPHNIEVITYNENHYAEKRKAYKIKGGYSARMTPFMLVLGENRSFKKAFYSEDNGCTIEKLSEWLTTI